MIKLHIQIVCTHRKERSEHIHFLGEHTHHFFIFYVNFVHFIYICWYTHISLTSKSVHTIDVYIFRDEKKIIFFLRVFLSFPLSIIIFVQLGFHLKRFFCAEATFNFHRVNSTLRPNCVEVNVYAMVVCNAI